MEFCLRRLSVHFAIHSQQQWRSQDFEGGRAIWRARNASLYGGLGVEPPSGFRGRAPGQGGDAFLKLAIFFIFTRMIYAQMYHMKRNQIGLLTILRRRGATVLTALLATPLLTIHFCSIGSTLTVCHNHRGWKFNRSNASVNDEDDIGRIQNEYHIASVKGTPVTTSHSPS